MSGYLELKYPFKSNIGLNPFKTWKRQWCILRPDPTRTGGGCLAMYAARAGSAAGVLELAAGSAVRRADSSSRPHVLAVFSPDEPHKPRVLLAAATAYELQLWMEKIRNLLNDSTAKQEVGTGSFINLCGGSHGVSCKTLQHLDSGVVSAAAAGAAAAAGGGGRSRRAALAEELCGNTLDDAGRVMIKGRQSREISAIFVDDSSDRRSLVSVASGVYEEIPEPPAAAATAARDEPAYESVAECVYATMRRTGRRPPPPPLPPRLNYGTCKAGDKADGGEAGRRRLGSDASALSHTTLPKARPAFNVFRKRLKSDPAISTKSDPAKENKDMDTKKKKFDFTPTKDIFRSFKVGRKMKGLKIEPTNLTKIGETKSCEFLECSDEVEVSAAAARRAASAECLEVGAGGEGCDEEGGGASPEDQYVAVSPPPPPPRAEPHYAVMSPRVAL